MRRELLLERVAGQTRLAVVEDRRLCEIYYERGTRTKLAGNIYAGRVQNVLPGMNAAFVDIGIGKNAFLYAGDICYDTREDQALKAKLDGARIEKMLRPGQMIVTQVAKEPGGSKGPRISGNVTLPGRLCVLIPTLEYVGVSKKIEDRAERDRLYAAAEQICASHGAGMIVRTAAEGVEAERIEADYLRLLAIWEKIRSAGEHSAKPRLLQNDGSLAMRVARDMLDDTIAAVRTDDEALYAELIENVHLLSPEYEGIVQLERSDTPLFDLLRVDHQLEKALSRHVYLKSGGTIVIDETEAMTVIDVNTGKFTGKKDLEETLFALNCEAAAEIARQLRLRDLGGIIIIDFIDMEKAEHRQQLLDYLREALKNDRNRTNVLGMTALGLVEMTRKKLRRPLSRLLMRDCSHCLATGVEWTHESSAYRAVREVWRRRRLGDALPLRIVTGERVAGWIRTIGVPEGCLLEESGSDEGFELLSGE